MRVDKDKLYLLHSRAYRDNSLLVDFLSLQHGRLSLVVAMRSREKKQTRQYLQPCQLLEASYLLKPNLGRLLEIDSYREGTYRPPIAMFIYYQYIHELLLKLLPAQEPVALIFKAYQQSLVLLCESAVHSALRHIEVALIELLLGLPNLSKVDDKQSLLDIDDKQPLYLSLHGGLSSKVPNEIHLQLDKMQAQALLDFIADTTDETAAKNAQRITTFYINQLLGKQQLVSRAMYKKLTKLVAP